MDSHEKEITKSLNGVYNALDKVLKNPYLGVSLVIGLGTIGKLLIATINTFTNKSGKFNSVLAQMIVSTAEKLDLENNINQFISTMTHIDRSLERIANNRSIQEDATLTNIHRDLEIQIENFDRKISVYRKYPILSISSLLVLNSYVVTFEALFNQKKPHLAQHSQMACDISRILHEYRTLTVYNRLELIDVTATYFFMEEKAKKIKDKLIPIVAGYTYNPNGYNRDTSIACAKVVNKSLVPPLMMYIKDDNSSYTDNNALNIENCLLDYMSFARYQVEQFFDKPISLTDLQCANNLQCGRKSENAPTTSGATFLQGNNFSIT